MKVHTTNYQNTFIEIAADCPALTGETPPVKGDAKSVANQQFDLLHQHPYKFTSDDIVFQVYAERNGLTKAELPKAKEAFFSKGQPCLRCSPLTKRYGWGIHNNEEGKIALVGCDTVEYKKFLKDKKLKLVKAMKTGK
jgi:hypothetical protein